MISSTSIESLLDISNTNSFVAPSIRGAMKSLVNKVKVIKLKREIIWTGWGKMMPHFFFSLRSDGVEITNEKPRAIVIVVKIKHELLPIRTFELISRYSFHQRIRQLPFDFVKSMAITPFEINFLMVLCVRMYLDLPLYIIVCSFAIADWLSQWIITVGTCFGRNILEEIPQIDYHNELLKLWIPIPLWI